MAGIEKHWYVLRAIGGKERKAKEALDAEILRKGLTDFVSPAVVPVEHVYQQRNGKKVMKEKILYSGYVFVEAELTKDVEFTISNVPNIIDFLRNKANKPDPMRDSEVSRMIGKADESGDDTADVQVPYTVGETVKVIDGPFNGFSGEIEEVDADKKTLKVMVKIFGRKTPLELGYLQVEKE